jgi:hypothetical protein
MSIQKTPARRTVRIAFTRTVLVMALAAGGVAATTGTAHANGNCGVLHSQYEYYFALSGAYQRLGNDYYNDGNYNEAYAAYGVSGSYLNVAGSFLSQYNACNRREP